MNAFTLNNDIKFIKKATLYDRYDVVILQCNTYSSFSDIYFDITQSCHKVNLKFKPMNFLYRAMKKFMYGYSYEGVLLHNYCVSTYIQQLDSTPVYDYVISQLRNSGCDTYNLFTTKIPYIILLNKKMCKNVDSVVMHELAHFLYATDPYFQDVTDNLYKKFSSEQIRCIYKFLISHKGYGVKDVPFEWMSHLFEHDSKLLKKLIKLEISTVDKGNLNDIVNRMKKYAEKILG